MAIDANTERMMQNWARWKEGGGIAGAVVSSAYDLEARGRREEVSIPLINGEAVDVNSAVDALTPELKLVVIVWWVQGGSQEKKAKECGVASIKTLYNRLDDAHARIHSFLAALRERGRKAREAYAKAREVQT